MLRNADWLLQLFKRDLLNGTAIPFLPPVCCSLLKFSITEKSICHRHTSFIYIFSQVRPPPPPPPTLFQALLCCLSAKSVIYPHMYSTGTVHPPSLGTDFADEPIHIINVSLQYEELEGKSDAELIMKCYKFVQVNEPGSLHEAADGLVSLGRQICALRNWFIQ